MAEQKNEPKKKKGKKRKNKNLIHGVDVDPEVIKTFNLVYKNTLRYAVFRLNEDETKIILDFVSPNKGTIKDLKERLPGNDVRWVICSLSYKLIDQSRRKKILFISWIPDTITRKTHKETIRVKSLGIFNQAHLFEAFSDKSMKQIQGNDHDDLDQEGLLRAVASYGEQIDFSSLWV